MKRCLMLFALLMMATGICITSQAADTEPTDPSEAPVYILPIREDIMPPLTYLVRRGVKEAIASNAQCLIIDMETNGGRVDVTEEIIQLINRFEGRKITYINAKAFSAGAFISVATQEIYMSPVSVIGAAAPIMLSPGGGAGEMPDTMEVKMTSGISALIRATAEQNGHDPMVVDAMIDKSKELTKDGVILSEKGQILTLTNTEAEKTYGDPPSPLLSKGTVASLDDLIVQLGYGEAPIRSIEPTGAEQVGTWINKFSSILLILGILGVYLEFKTPGFGLPGILGLTAFAIYFLGGYVAGLSGLEWAALFVLGLFLLIIELFFIPGTMIVGLFGAGLMLWSLLMGLVDLDPTVPVWHIPSAAQFKYPLQVLGTSIIGSAICIVLLSTILPKTTFYGQLISATTSAEQSVVTREKEEKSMMGCEGVSVSTLRPGGKGEFDGKLLDVITDGDMISSGKRIRIVGFSAHDAIVEEVKS
ncbi:MAG: nodulation protein NfeD [Verrucomicrobiota bacterium]